MYGVVVLSVFDDTFLGFRLKRQFKPIFCCCCCCCFLVHAFACLSSLIS